MNIAEPNQSVTCIINDLLYKHSVVVYYRRQNNSKFLQSFQNISYFIFNSFCGCRTISMLYKYGISLEKLPLFVLCRAAP